MTCQNCKNSTSGTCSEHLLTSITTGTMKNKLDIKKVEEINKELLFSDRELELRLLADVINELVRNQNAVIGYLEEKKTESIVVNGYEIRTLTGPVGAGNFLIEDTVPKSNDTLKGEEWEEVYKKFSKNPDYYLRLKRRLSGNIAMKGIDDFQLTQISWEIKDLIIEDIIKLFTLLKTKI